MTAACFQDRTSPCGGGSGTVLDFFRTARRRRVWHQARLYRAPHVSRVSNDRRGPQLRRRCGDVKLSAVRVSAARHTPAIVGAPILTVKLDVTICHTGMYATLAHARLSEMQAVALQAVHHPANRLFSHHLHFVPSASCHNVTSLRMKGTSRNQKYFSSSEAASLFGVV